MVHFGRKVTATTVIKDKDEKIVQQKDPTTEQMVDEIVNTDYGVQVQNMLKIFVYSTTSSMISQQT